MFIDDYINDRDQFTLIELLSHIAEMEEHDFKSAIALKDFLEEELELSYDDALCATIYREDYLKDQLTNHQIYREGYKAFYVNNYNLLVAA